MTNNRLTPLEKLRQEKALLKIECSESEERLSGHWIYVRNNLGSLVFHSAVRGVGRQLGLVKEDKSEPQGKKTSGLMQGLIGSAVFAAPFVWDMVQPMMMGYLISKVKNLFFGKKKKK